MGMKRQHYFFVDTCFLMDYPDFADKFIFDVQPYTIVICKRVLSQLDKLKTDPKLLKDPTDINAKRQYERDIERQPKAKRANEAALFAIAGRTPLSYGGRCVRWDERPSRAENADEEIRQLALRYARGHKEHQVIFLSSDKNCCAQAVDKDLEAFLPYEWAIKEKKELSEFLENEKLSCQASGKDDRVKPKHDARENIENTHLDYAPKSRDIVEEKWESLCNQLIKAREIEQGEVERYKKEEMERQELKRKQQEILYQQEKQKRETLESKNYKKTGRSIKQTGNVTNPIQAKVRAFAKRYPTTVMGLVALFILVCFLGMVTFLCVILPFMGTRTSAMDRTEALPVVEIIDTNTMRISIKEKKTPTVNKYPTTTGGPVSATKMIINTETATNISQKNPEKDGAVLLLVPAGSFFMGDSGGEVANQPRTTIYLDAFWIDRTEVTNRMYALCVEAKQCLPPARITSRTRSQYYGNDRFAEYPVIYVSWFQAQTYCAWAGRRLPTEAEWEKAARGTDGRAFSWGNDFKIAGNYEYAYGKDTTTVGSFPDSVSPYGAMDMLGNVWEWVNDWYYEGYYKDCPLSNPTGPAKGINRSVRGGSFGTNEWYFLTTFNRTHLWPYTVRDTIGFRCAATG
jgi:formylglycine-generating enzyme required for sulfatase activity